MASTYLHSNTGTATNAKKFTLSMWIKRAKLCDSNSQRFYQGYKDGNDRFYIMFDNTSGTPDAIWIYAVTGGTIELYWTSTRRFRDTNGWYNFVFSADSTQAAQADRFKVYVNGVEETSWTKTNNPSQNIDWGNQLAQTNNTLTISGTESHTQLFDGSMSHIHFIDGTAYDASAFGSTDSTTGEWKINTSPSVTYGNNGYFILKDGNSVTDSSPNSNDFSVGAGTLTKTEDCPSNVFATLDPLSPQNYTFSNGNNTIYRAGSTGQSTALATLAPSSGKWYWEIKLNSGQSDYPRIGIYEMNSDNHTYTNYLGQQGGGTGKWWGSGTSQTGIIGNGTDSSTAFFSYSNGDILMFAMDNDNGKLWFGKNGTWYTNDNSTTTTGTAIGNNTATPAFSNVTVGKNWTPAVFGNASGETWQCNFGNGYFGTSAVSSAGTNASGIGIFEYDVPPNFTALSTKGLNE